MKRLRGIAGLCVAAAIFCAALVAGCGGSDSSDASAKEFYGLRATRPEIKLPVGLPPKKLVVRDMKKGTGKEAQKGDEIEIQYYGIQWRGGEHANSWRYERVPNFILGSHRLLHGLNIGIQGMKEGGSREIIIPSTLVYYPGIEHHHLSRLDALVYKVYLVKVFKKKTASG